MKTNNYLTDIGKKIKIFRSSGKLTLQDVALKAGITKGLLSKIENGRTIPSLPVLLSVIGALGIQTSAFFSSIDYINTSKYLIIRGFDKQPTEKEGVKGYMYFPIFNRMIHDSYMEIVYLEVEPYTTKEAISTDAYEFKYLIDGFVDYAIDNETTSLYPGDAICFDGRLPHILSNKTSSRASLLVIYLYDNMK
jgi:transcriptional regulator with XRE-family HTH domain